MLPTTKAGPGEKEPAYIVLKRHAFKFLLLLALTTALVLLKFYSNALDASQLRASVQAFAHNLHFAEVAEVSSFARIGEELERHLDRDVREMEVAQQLILSLRDKRKSYIENATGQVRSVFERHMARLTPERRSELESDLAMLRDDLTAQVAATAEATLDGILQDVAGLVKRLTADAERARHRLDGLQDQLAKKLEHASEVERGVPGDLDGDGFIEDIDGDGLQEIDNAVDDEWAMQTERWHNQTVTSFFDHMHGYLQDPNTTRYRLRTQSRLFQELDTALEHLYEDKVPWHDVEDLLHARKTAMQESGLPEYEDAEKPSDDEYTGYQSWHVQSFLEDCLWPAKLFEKLDVLKALEQQWKQTEKTSLEVVGELEDLSASNAIPHQWLHHGLDDDLGFAGFGGDDYF